MVTQLYYQVYITYQLHVSANAAVAIIRLDTIYQRNYINVAVVTQLYYQVYITYQLHVSANAAVAIIRVDKIYQRSHINMI